jgi:hypothetical protein
MPEQPTELVLFPQPASDVLALRLAPSVTGVRAIAMFDLLGREVFRNDLRTSTHCETVHIDLNGLRAGPYILTVEHVRGVLSRMVLVK